MSNSREKSPDSQPRCIKNATRIWLQLQAFRCSDSKKLHGTSKSTHPARLSHLWTCMSLVRIRVTPGSESTAESTTAGVKSHRCLYLIASSAAAFSLPGTAPCRKRQHRPRKFASPKRYELISRRSYGGGQQPGIISLQGVQMTCYHLQYVSLAHSEASPSYLFPTVPHVHGTSWEICSSPVIYEAPDRTVLLTA